MTTARSSKKGHLRHRIEEAVRGIHTAEPRTRHEALAGTSFYFLSCFSPSDFPY